ncbi:uncharacterized protein TNCT_418211 [Trichonephila clavata]|uniref:Uncharacterized protein n=1 Tax=Trichonephila clavata TaxID=2740835 RepID=A0A8X6K6F5_TRICU|nr:uncharacterized protein TNCT_418211 [Trichonephila clavata]
MGRENENLEREIESQKKKRTVVRQLTTKLLSKIEANLSADVEKKEILEDLKVQLEFKMSELRSLNEKIENHVLEPEFENEITSSQEYQEKIETVQGKIQRLLNRKLNSERRSEADNNEIKGTVIVKSSEKRVMNLPRFQIETFYGDSCKWLYFWNQFKTTIHGNDDLRKTEKFAYLKSLLGGNALPSISGFAISDQNYDSSIEILKERFGKTDIVISSHMNKLLAIEPIRNISYLKGLHKLYDECEIQVRSLNSLNVTSGSYGNLLCPIILQKIQEELNLEFNRYRKKDTEFPK